MSQKFVLSVTAATVLTGLGWVFADFMVTTADNTPLKIIFGTLAFSFNFLWIYSGIDND